MFIDHAVIAGVSTVMLILSFFAGLSLFLCKEPRKRRKD
ncbi:MULTISPECIES: cytochrome c oxidase subunit CcoM [unclassified Pseudomonas]|nr:MULTISPECIES: cytochrome c oxidase subunit CcoM [unclassified Pseudomonas]